MKLFTFAALGLMLVPVAVKAQCGTYESPDKSKKIKVIVWSEENDCFKLLLDGQPINPDSARQVTFWVNVQAPLQKLTVQVHGQEDKKTILVNDDIASLSYRVSVNKKGEYSLKNEPFKGQHTAEAQAREKSEFDANVQKQKDEKAKADKEWADKRAAEEAEREKQRAADREKEAQVKAERDARWAQQREAEDKERAARQPQPEVKDNSGAAGNGGGSSASSGNGANGSSGTPASTAAAAGVKNPMKYDGTNGKQVTDGANMMSIRYVYNGQPLKNMYITVTMRDSTIIAQVLTDDDGKAQFKSNFPEGRYTFDYFGERNGVKWSIAGIYTGAITYNNKELITNDFADGVAYIAEMMGMDKATIARSFGFE